MFDSLAISIGEMSMLQGAIASESSGGGSPTVFTLVLDDLLTRSYPGSGQAFALTATAGTTGTVNIDDGFTIYSASAIATDIQTQLEALGGYSGKVTVSGSSTEAGDKYTFTITFDASLGAVTLDFDGSSQWYPTITLTEAVTQQGVTEVTGVAAVFTLNCDVGNSADSNPEQVNLSSGGSVVFGDDSIIVDNDTAPSGWARTSGGMGSPFVTFTKNDPGAASLSIVSQTSDGSYSLTEDVVGVDAVAGAVEIHTITPTPVNPTGGTWKPLSAGTAIAYDADTTTIANQIGTAFDPGMISIPTISGTLDAGTVTVTAPNVGEISDTALGPYNSGLTAPEITHSIS